MNSYVIATLVIAATIGFCWRINRYFSNLNKNLENMVSRDPYLDSVRNMRRLNNNDATVILTDEDTGEHFMYAKGSEVRMKRNASNRFYIDTDGVKEMQNGDRAN